ncbi:MAG: hypothetical protein JST68_05130 [Bacteroidetes bacterium]|nr:hypothetical protein [Bacteroidota bacterium]
MKALFLSTCALFLTLLSQAQFKKGDITLAGSLGFSQQTPKSDNGTTATSSYKVTNLQINPSIGWALSDDLIYGLNLSYSHGKTTFDPNNISKVNGYGAGIFLRKYAYLGSKFYFFSQGSLNANFGSQDQISNPSMSPNVTTHTTLINLNLYPGIAYSLNRHWQLETGFPQLLGLYYSHSTETDRYNGQPDVHSSVNGFGLSSVLGSTYQLSVGLRYFITKS